MIYAAINFYTQQCSDIKYDTYVSDSTDEIDLTVKLR